MSVQHEDVLLIVDAATLLVAHPNASLNSDTPTPIDGRHVYILNSSDAQQIGRNDSEIAAQLSPGDELRMRESALSLRAEESVLFYRFTLAEAYIVSSIKAAIRDGTVAVPDPEDLLHPKTQHIKEHFWRSQVLAPGKASCAMDFFVLGSEKKLRYFRWETRINITDGGAV